MQLEFLDSTMGLRPERNAESFNNIVYTTQYAIGEGLRFNNIDFAKRNLMTHIGANQDSNGLYIPKASHDNMTYLILGAIHFNMPFYLEKIKFFPLIAKTGIFRPWDVILYAYLLAPKPLKWLLTPLTLLPVLQSIHSCIIDYKTRPIWYERIDTILQFPTKIKSEPIFSGYADTFLLKNGQTFTVRHMQNDGKHLSSFKMYVLRHENFIFKWGARICDAILTKKYGNRYIAHIMNNYFPESDHPNRVVYENVENFIVN